jgi:signal transduction histidine kinase
VHGDPRTVELQDYVRARHVTSMLDVPVWTRGLLTGVLCHEHVGPQRRWTPSELNFAMAIAQTIGATLEGYARSAAEEERRKMAFLDQCSMRLTALRDVCAVAREATEMAVPELADGATLDLLQDGQLVRAGLAHRTAEGRAVLEEIARRFPPRLKQSRVNTRLLRMRQSVLVPQLTQRAASIAGVGGEEWKLIERLRVGSVLSLPLTVGERALGILQFHASDRRYDQGDMRYAGAYAQRVAMALENAQLHEKADAAIHARDEFIAMAAHELHGPLASLQLSSESLAESLASSDGSDGKMSHTIVRQVHRLSRLVDHMLDASRVMTRKLSLSPSPVDLGRLVQEVAEGFSERAQRSGSQVSLDIQPDVQGEWDADRLAQVISNLIDNALKFGCGKAIEISLHNAGDDAVLRVRDQGIGIAPDRIASVFDPFIRAVSPRSFGGLGLGLFVTKAIVGAHSGEITVQSQPNEGTVFEVRLPKKPTFDSGKLGDAA